MEGQIYKIHSDFYYVDDGISSHECKVREVLKKQREKILVGDFVEFDNGFITGIIKRKNYISRPSVANIDQIIIVSALKEPDLNLTQLDRYITLANYYNIPAVLCFNKNDLKWDRHLSSKLKSIYEPLGYKIAYTSATEHKGIKNFEKILEGKTSVMCGNSGVGKSSLINAINPDLNLRTKEVSEKTQRGTHTTRHCEIIKIGKNSRIVDTPGFSNVKFDFILPAKLDLLFPDLAEYKNLCKYSDCLHITESGCNILKNLEHIASSRYQSYCEFINEAKEYKDRIKFTGQKRELAKKIINNKQIAKISNKKRQNSRNTTKQKLQQEINNN